MPPPSEEKEKPLQPRPKPPKPKPKTAPEPKPRPDDLEHYWTPGGGAGTLPPDPCAADCSGSCAFLPHCSQPPPAPPATVHLSSSRLPTPLIALSASLLALSAVLLLALLVHRLARRRRRRRMLAQNAALAAAHHHDAEQGGQQVLAGGSEEEEEEEDAVHHVWYIRTKGLDERAIAAIAAVVYDAGSKQKRGGAGGDGDDGSCAVCLAEFRHGETLRLLPRCGHAFHRGCIDTWLRAHVNCPLCRAPVQVPAAAADPDAAPVAGAPAARNPRGGSGGGSVHLPEGAERGGGGALVAERGVRRAASMVPLPRRAWPGDASFRAPASSSGREGDMAGGIGKIMRLLKFSDSLEEMAGVGVGVGAGRSVSFGAGRCQRLPPAMSGPSAAGVGVSSDEMPQRTG